jgi:hypothetical protein
MKNKKYGVTIQNCRLKNTSPNDLYSTHPESVRLFLDTFKPYPSAHYFWEPAAGTGNISRVLSEYNFQHYDSDKFDYNYPLDDINDFLEYDIIPDNNITDLITNPPFKYAKDFVYKFHELFENKKGSWGIFYLKLLFLESKKRLQLFEKFPIKYIYIHSSRQGCSPTGEWNFKNNGAVCYAWFIWEIGYTGNTCVRWIR